VLINRYHQWLLFAAWNIYWDDLILEDARILGGLGLLL